MASDWIVKYDDDVAHVLPVEDIIIHDEDYQVHKNPFWFISNAREYLITSHCVCTAQIKYIKDGKTIIVHDALDGRIVVEMAKEILNGQK